MNKRSITLHRKYQYIFDTQTGLMKQCNSNLIHSNFDNKFVFIRLSNVHSAVRLVRSIDCWPHRLALSLFPLHKSSTFDVWKSIVHVSMDAPVLVCVVHMFGRCRRVLCSFKFTMRTLHVPQNANRISIERI